MFEDIFDEDGSELYIKPVGQYVEPGRDVTFYTVLEAARRKGETAFGYKIAAEFKANQPDGGVHINPKKTLPIRFSEEDCVIVAAEE